MRKTFGPSPETEGVRAAATAALGQCVLSLDSRPAISMRMCSHPYPYRGRAAQERDSAGWRDRSGTGPGPWIALKTLIQNVRCWPDASDA